MSEENKRIVETLSHQNICLNELRQYIHQSFINAGGSKVKFSDTWLCDLVNDYIFPSPVVEDAQEEEPSDEFFKVFKRFSIYRGEDITFDNLTSETLRDFEKYLLKEHTFYKVEGKNWRDKKVTFLDKRFARAYKSVPECRLPARRGGNAISKIMVELCFLAGLDRTVTTLNPTTREEEKHPMYEVASSHMARRCFIGNLYKQVQDPNLVGKLSGHAEGSKAFARYRDIDEEMQKELVKMLE